MYRLPFIDRLEELHRLDDLHDSRGGGLAVVYGRRRIGKTRLLIEWIKLRSGLYVVADQSSSTIQRRYLAEALSSPLPGFGDVEYPDWETLLTRLAADAGASGWTGPLVVDELPYLVTTSPSLPSVLQRWLDHEAVRSRLDVVLAGSSQRMMQGLVLSSNAPLYGRASEIIHVRPLEPTHIQKAFRNKEKPAIVETWAAWGGVPRYWELAAMHKAGTLESIERLVLDPLGTLHEEPSRLLTEEVPQALEVRPVLDAIGMGAHRVSEIAGRSGHKATSLSRPLDRLLGMDLVAREVPFGEPEKSSKRSLYRISDPFLRLWFRVVAPHRAFLAAAPRRQRLSLLRKLWPALVSEAWEDLCRLMVPKLTSGLEAFGPASRWWRGDAPEWDVVAESPVHERLLLGEAHWTRRPMTGNALERAARRIASKPPPSLPRKFASHGVVRALFVPWTAPRSPRIVEDVRIVTLDDML